MTGQKINLGQFKTEAIAAALTEGFVCAGIAAVGPVSHSGRLTNWIDSGMNADMTYLADRWELYANLTNNFTWARSVLCMAAFYGGESETKDGELFAMYAKGRDYHKILFKAAQRVAESLTKFSPDLQYRVCVDTAPVPERHLAADAGIGWIGRSGMLINDTYGSRLLLAEIVLDVELPPDAPVENHCHNCKHCQQACPNSAIVDYATVDARRCNSWATIENRGAIDPEIFNTRGYVFGCDICASACPFNKKADEISLPDNALTAELRSPSDIAKMSLPEILQLNYDKWDMATRGSAVRRCGYEGLLRNAAIAAGWRKSTECAAALEKLARHNSILVSTAARWALDMLEK